MTAGSAAAGTLPLCCGVDIGGTKIAVGVVDGAGALLEEVRVTSPATEAAAITDVVTSLVADLRRRHVIAAVGVGAAGFIDQDRSVVRFAPNLAWRDEPLRAELEARLALPVVVENDANAAAWGEFRFGAGEDVDDLLLVTVGTGVGGGIVLDGRLHRGAFGIGGEIGHLRMVPGGRRCGCGNLGCLEAYGSGTALVRSTRESVAAGDRGGAALLELAGGDLEAIDGPLVTAAARAGDEFARARLAELGRWLGEGIASLTAVLDPAVAVIGGGVAAADDLLLDPIREAYVDQLSGRGHRPLLEIRRARLDNDAGLVGAADLARS